MTVLNRRSRMVSFRLSHEEYEEALAVCSSHGVRSVSTLARHAVLGITRAGAPPTARLEAKLDELAETLSRALYVLKSPEAPGNVPVLRLPAGSAKAYHSTADNVPAEDNHQ